jgi:hypothetical protein
VTIVYLDVDDEITSAAARIRTAEEIDVALVLPAGSRIATSRINFRLLAREANERSRRLAIVAPEASTRALAASAGLPVFASVMEYGEAHEGPDDGEAASAAAPPVAPDPQTAPAAAGSAAARAAAAAVGMAGAAAVVPAATSAASRPGAAAAPRPPDLPAPSPPEGARQRAAVGASTGLTAPRPVAAPRRRRWPLVAALLLGVLVLAGTGAAVGYVVLPTAVVTVRLASEPVGPITFIGTADPDVVAVDAASATIPADRIVLPLEATGTFPATGTRVEEAAATGTVEWQNCDPSRSYTIPSGTVVRTASGVGFATNDGILVPVAILSGTPPNLSVKCQLRSVDVVAVRAGPDGNVDAGAIRIVPGAYDPGLVLVSNPAATSGGLREEFPVVVRKDVVAAFGALTAQLDEQLAAAATAPPGLAAGATPYPETARRGEPVMSEPVADIVGREAESFDLTLTAEGTVVAADPAPLEAIGAARVTAMVPDGMQVREGSIRVEIGPGVVEGETIRYPVAARAEAVRDITVDEVRQLVVGKTPEEAREILADYGSVEIVVWPDWVATITGIDARIKITVEGLPPAEPAPAPSSPPSPTPTPPGPSASPQPSVTP